MTANFWDKVNAQLEESRTATSADQLLAILSHARNPYGDPSMAANAEGFFAGDSGELLEVLLESGWSTMWLEAEYHWALIAPDSGVITYVEGDLFKGNQKPMPHLAPEKAQTVMENHTHHHTEDMGSGVWQCVCGDRV